MSEPRNRKDYVAGANGDQDIDASAAAPAEPKRQDEEQIPEFQNDRDVAPDDAEDSDATSGRTPTG